MFDDFSSRSKQIVFAARFKAGERGATTIDTDDFLLGLVLEDRELLVKKVFFHVLEGEGTFVDRGQPHVPFISAELAEVLLTNLEENLLHSQPVPLTTDIPLSASLERIFDSAKAIRARLRHNRVEPLHLLATILKEDSGEGSETPAAVWNYAGKGAVDAQRSRRELTRGDHVLKRVPTLPARFIRHCPDDRSDRQCCRAGCPRKIVTKVQSYTIRSQIAICRRSNQPRPRSIA